MGTSIPRISYSPSDRNRYEKNLKTSFRDHRLPVPEGQTMARPSRIGEITGAAIGSTPITAQRRNDRKVRAAKVPGPVSRERQEPSPGEPRPAGRISPEDGSPQTRPDNGRSSRWSTIPCPRDRPRVGPRGGTIG